MPSDEAKLALWFLHHYAGVLMYFPGLPKLNDIQVVYDSITNLIVNTWKSDQSCKAASERFRETGQFCLQQMHLGTSFHLESLLGFWSISISWHQSAIPIIVVRNSKTTYLMPCVLQNAASHELNVYRESTSSPPLHLLCLWLCTFPAMIANLGCQTARCSSHVSL